MRKIILSALFVFNCVLAQAQVNYESTGDYAKLYDITYDATVQNKIYARTLYNHIVVSTNQGTSWQVLYSHPSGVDHLKLVNNNTAIAFTSPEGVNILSLSTNEVVKLFEIPATGVPGAGAPYVTDYSIYGTDNTTAVIGIGFGLGFDNFGKTFYSNNGGEDYNEIYYTVENNDIFIQRVAIAPNNPEKIYLTRGNGKNGVSGGLLVSTNAGETFTEQLAGIVLDAIAFKPNVPNEIIVGTGITFGQLPENVYKTVDDGANWVVQDITFDNVTLDNITQITYHPADTDKIIILEENEIISTTDGGENWTSQVFEVGVAMDYYYGINASFDPFDTDRAIITTDFYPQVTTDYGATLTQIKAPFNASNSVSVAQTGESATHLYYGSQGGYITKDLATGTANAYEILNPDVFTSASRSITADPVVTGRSFLFDAGGFFGSTLSVSTDYAATTTPILNTFGAAIQQITVDPNNANIVYIVIRSNDNSSLFKFDLTNLENVTNEQIITPGEIFEEPEEGQPSPATGVITGLIVDKENSNNITIAKFTEIYNSTDGGATWTEVETTGLTLNPATDIIWDMAQSPVEKNNIILSSNVGIFTSTDGGVTWASSLPGYNVRKVTYSPTNANVAAAAVYSGQNIDAVILATRNNGASWTVINPSDIEYATTGSVDFAFGAESLTAYIATIDLGVMSYVVDYDVLGTDDNPQLPKNNIAIYPNPASSVLNITVSDNSEIKNTVIYTLAGQKVIETAATSINVSALSNGIYIVKSTTSSGASYSQKLVKQ